MQKETLQNTKTSPDDRGKLHNWSEPQDFPTSQVPGWLGTLETLH